MPETPTKVHEPDPIILGFHQLAEDNPPEENGLYEWEQRFVDQFVAAVLAIQKTRNSMSPHHEEYEQVAEVPTIRMPLVIAAIETALAEETDGIILSTSPVTGIRRHGFLYVRYLRVTF